MGTMASSTHQFGVLDLIRAGLQDLDTARTLLDELRADGIDDDRLCLLMKTLEQTCEPDIALRNLVDIIKALQSQGRDFHQVITDDAGLGRLVTVLGVSVTVAMVLTALIAGLVQTYVLDALSLGYLQTLVFAAIVLIVVYAMNAVAKAAFKKDLGVYFPVIALNSAADALSLGESILTALGAGLGFWLALAAFAAVRSKIRERYVPKAWRGLPIYLLTAAILSMALLAF